MMRSHCASVPGEHIGRTVTVLDIGGVDDGTDQKTLCIDDDVPLPALDFLPAS